MSEGPWQSRAGSSPSRAPGAPGDDPGYPSDPDDPADPGYPADVGYPADDPDGLGRYPALRDGADGQDGRGWRDAGRRRWGLDRRGRRLGLAGLAVALVSALVGGLLGGYVATRSQGTSTAPGYSLGPVPRALTGRPASSLPGIAARVLPSVVMIRVNGGEGTGSGFAVRGGFVITDNHVVTLDGHARDATLQIVFGNGVTVPARLVGRDTYSDIAVVKPVGARGLRGLPLGNSAGIAVGDSVVAFGAPLGLAGTVTSGIVSALGRPVQPGAGNGPAAPQVFLEAIQTDAPINPGNSGGPLVNSRGQVIGVNAAFDTLGGSMITGQGGSIGLGFAIPINQVRRVAVQLIRTGHATHAVIGALLNLKYGGQGAQIATGVRGSPAVTAGGPAAAAGLRAGDIITSFGRQPIPNAQTLLDAIRSRAPGAVVRVGYTGHGGQSHVSMLRLGSARS
jgi:S1-C subfamily serine protease